MAREARGASGTGTGGGALVAGVDVGTGSVRAALFSTDGHRVGHAVRPIRTWTGCGGLVNARAHAGAHAQDAWFVEQSSDDIWAAVCAALRGAADEAARVGARTETTASGHGGGARDSAGGVLKRVAGISFDATCSLVVLDSNFTPVIVSPEPDASVDVSGDGGGAMAAHTGSGAGAGSAEPARNVIVWSDHRATEQAARINDTGHDVLSYVGGQMSPEMQPPKLLWLKQRMPDAWAAAVRGHCLDLTDYLTWRAAGSLTRSLCTTVCKWGRMGHVGGGDGSGGDSAGSVGSWDASFWRAIGLGDVADASMAESTGVGESGGGFACVGTHVRLPGDRVGDGVSASAAAELGLRRGTAVGVGLIDAHAGALGMLGVCDVTADKGGEDAAGAGAGAGTAAGKAAGKAAGAEALFMICGTSTCHMAVSEGMVRVPGVWGPYKHALVPGMWLLEGGQSAFGSLIDAVIRQHPAYNGGVDAGGADGGGDDDGEGDSAGAVRKGLRDLAAEGGVTVYTLLNAHLDVIAAGADDDSKAAAAGSGEPGSDRVAAAENVRRTRLTRHVHVDPHYLGNRSPLADPSLRGAIMGRTMDAGIDAAAVEYLAAVQAAAYGTRHIIEALTERGVAVKQLPLCGGGAKNPLLLRELADVTGCELLLPDESETVALGAAVLAAAAAGCHGSVAAAAASMSRLRDGGRIAPSADPRVRAYHEAKYGVYKAMVAMQVQARRAMDAACDDD